MNLPYILDNALGIFLLLTVGAILGHLIGYREGYRAALFDARRAIRKVGQSQEWQTEAAQEQLGGYQQALARLNHNSASSK